MLHRLVAAVLLVHYALAETTPVASEFCKNNWITNKFYYADPDDCHSYYQCDGDGINTFHMPCPNGTFWSGAIIQCVPERPETPCTDRCIDLDASACYPAYGDDQCSTFYRCSNTISFQFCCPTSTAFNATTCQCDEDTTCQAVCTPPPRPELSTLAPPTIVGNDSCIDSYGNTLKPVTNDQTKFINGEAEFSCATGTWFNLATCDCSIFSSGDAGPEFGKQCLLYMPFDTDFKDYSANKFSTQSFGSVAINGTYEATGDGAAVFQDGWIEVPGTANYDFKNYGTWCFFFNTTRTGGSLLSVDDEGANYPILVKAQTGGLAVSVRFVRPSSVVSLFGTFEPLVIFQHTCVVADGSFLKLYMNNVLVDTKLIPFAGNVAMSYAPIRVGSDGFFGIIDELLVCPFAMTVPQLQAHFAADTAFLQSEGLIPPSPAVDSTQV